MIHDRLTYGRKTPWQASRRERKRGLDLTSNLRGMTAMDWLVEDWLGIAKILLVRCKRTRDVELVVQINHYVRSLRTTVTVLSQNRREQLLIDASWYWTRYTQLSVEACRYRELNGMPLQATLRCLAMNLLRVEGFWSITDVQAALVHDIPCLLVLLGWLEPTQLLSSG